MNQLLILALTSLAFAANAHAQSLVSQSGAEIAWTRSFASDGVDWINDIAPLNNGHMLAVGFLNGTEGDPNSDWRALAVEFDADGTVTRQSEYGAGGGVDAFWSAAQTVDGDIFQSGFTTRIGAGGIDALIMRTDANGVVLRETSIGDTAYDRVTDMAPTADGGFIMAGHSVMPGTENRRILVAKADASGAELWRRIYTHGESSGGLYIEATANDGFVLSGGTSDGAGNLLVIKLNADGDEIWRRSIGAPDTPDTNHGLVVRADGRIVAVGYTGSWGAVENDLFAVTLSPDGELLQRSVLGGGGDDRAILARTDANGRIWVIGYTTSAGAGDWDVILAALNDDGRFMPGVAIFAGREDDNGAALYPLAGGDLLLGGYSASLGNGNVDAFLMRVTAPDLSYADPRFVIRPEN